MKKDNDKEYNYHAWVRSNGGRGLSAVFADAEGNLISVSQRKLQEALIGNAEDSPHFLTREMAETALMNLAAR